ncbi:MAG TPA: hypothetical protein VFE32_15770 [Puia sp.]|nr:hypothetical protein [Puia sp.]
MNKSIVISIALALVFLLYFPVLGNGFLTDDYAALYRILVEKRILYRDMLRPLIDITFYCNYLISGLHPLGYYIFNFLVHGMNCYLVYLVATRVVLFADRRQQYFALLSGLAFALYPFHNEPIVWLSGRLSSLATAAGLWAIYLSQSRKPPRDWIWPALLWILGLFAYESIIGLPLIVLALRFSNRRRFMREALVWAGVGIVWVLIHFVLAGSMLPDYGRSSLAKQDGGGLWIRWLKVAGRCFLPPDDKADWMTKAFGAVGVVLLAVNLVLLLRRPARAFVAGYAKLAVAFAVALVAPAMIGVSTQTSEGDRLLYFPSVFLCMLGVAALLQLTRRRVVWWGVSVLFGGIGLLLIEANNENWMVASRTATAIVDSVRGGGDEVRGGGNVVRGGKVVLVNLPDEWQGAYIFRNNFEQSMVINGIDTASVVVNNKVMRPEYMHARSFGDVKQGDSVFISPVTVIVREGEMIEVDNVRTGVRRMLPAEGTRVYYWDKYGWKKIAL